MKELFLTVKDDILHPDIRDVEIPIPKDDEVLIKVNVAGTNPKDWKVRYLLALHFLYTS